MGSLMIRFIETMALWSFLFSSIDISALNKGMMSLLIRYAVPLKTFVAVLRISKIPLSLSMLCQSLSVGILSYAHRHFSLLSELQRRRMVRQSRFNVVNFSQEPNQRSILVCRHFHCRRCAIFCWFISNSLLIFIPVFCLNRPSSFYRRLDLYVSDLIFWISFTSSNSTSSLEILSINFSPESFGHRMCQEQDPESKIEMEGRERLGEEMHKNECDRSGGQRCTEENVDLCGEGHVGYEYEGGNGLGPLCLEEYYWWSDPC